MVEVEFWDVIEYSNICIIDSGVYIYICMFLFLYIILKIYVGFKISLMIWSCNFMYMYIFNDIERGVENY